MKKKSEDRLSFWAPEVREFLEKCDRQDLIDRGDQFAERVAALILTALFRLETYAKSGDLYNAQGGKSALADKDTLIQLEQFVNVRLKQEVEALEELLNVFDELRVPENLRPSHENTVDFKLPSWY